MSTQRWHEWRNADTTTCPAYGVVRLVVPVYNPPDGQVPGGGIVGIEPIITSQEQSFARNEIFGTTYILHGMRPGYDISADIDYYYPLAYRGFSIHFAFNGDTSVEPGGLGLLTWDLPTWASVGFLIDKEPGSLNLPRITPDQGIWTFGAIITTLSDWKVACVAIPKVLRDNTGCLYSLGADEAAKRVFVGAGVIYGGDEGDFENG